MERRLGRIPVFSIISLLLLAGVVVLWVRSRRHADIVGYYTPAGHLQGFTNDRAGLILYFSDVPFGQEMGLSADAMSASAEDFAPVHDLLFDPANVKHKFLGFQSAAAPIGSWGWKFSAWIVPYWALIVPLTILPLLRVRGFLIRRRRAKHGQCLACGYDLRHSEERCPECGEPINPQQSTAAAQDRTNSSSGRLTGTVPWLLLAVCLAGAGGLFCRGGCAIEPAAVAPAETKYQARVLRRTDLPGQSAGDVQHWASPQGLSLGPSSSAPRIVRSYPVAGLLAPRLVDEEQLVHLSGQLTPSPTGGNQAVMPNCHTPMRKLLTDLILSVALGDQSASAGGSSVDGVVFGDRLWVWQTQQVHWAVRTMLAEMQSVAAPSTRPSTSPATDSHATLDRPIAEFQLESTTLEAAIKMLTSQTRCNIVVYWPDLEQIGIRRDTPIALHLWNVTLDRALGAVLTLAGGEYPGMRVVRDGVIVISAPERLRKGVAAVRVYDVRDLIAAYCAAHPQPEARFRAYDQPATVNATAAEDGAEEIIRIIEDYVDTDSWKDNGGEIGLIRVFNGMLIISQSPSGHREIEELFRKLRAGEKPLTRCGRVDAGANGGNDGAGETSHGSGGVSPSGQRESAQAAEQCKSSAGGGGKRGGTQGAIGIAEGLERIVKRRKRLVPVVGEGLTAGIGIGGGTEYPEGGVR